MAGCFCQWLVTCSNATQTGGQKHVTHHVSATSKKAWDKKENTQMCHVRSPNFGGKWCIQVLLAHSKSVFELSDDAKEK